MGAWEAGQGRTRPREEGPGGEALRLPAVPGEPLWASGLQTPPRSRSTWPPGPLGEDSVRPQPRCRPSASGSSLLPTAPVRSDPGLKPGPVHVSTEGLGRLARA